MTLKPTSLGKLGAYQQGWFSARLKGISALLVQKVFLPGSNDNNYMPSIAFV